MWLVAIMTRLCVVCHGTGCHRPGNAPENGVCALICSHTVVSGAGVSVSVMEIMWCDWCEARDEQIVAAGSVTGHLSLLYTIYGLCVIPSSQWCVSLVIKVAKSFPYYIQLSVGDIVTIALMKSRPSLAPSLKHIDGYRFHDRGARFGFKVGHIDPESDKSGAFSDQISVPKFLAKILHPCSKAACEIISNY